MKGKLAFLEKWYEAVKQLARHKHAEPALAGISFVESSFFPIPPDLMLIPMVQADHSKAWRYAFVCSIASVLGGIFGYFLGVFFFESVMVPFFEAIHKKEALEGFISKVQESENSEMVVFGAALTPFPYKVITISAGAAKVGFGAFVAASVIGRSIRFFLVAGIVKKFGDQAERIMKEHFGKFTIALFLLLIGLYYAYKTLLPH